MVTEGQKIPNATGHGTDTVSPYPTMTNQGSGSQIGRVFDKLTLDHSFLETPDLFEIQVTLCSPALSAFRDRRPEFLV